MWTTTTQPVLTYQWGVVIGASLIAAVIDVTDRRIPNWLTGSLLATGLATAAWSGGTIGLAQSVTACVLLGLPYALLFLFAGGEPVMPR